MSKIILKKDDYAGQPTYALLEPILDLLLSNGNEIATPYRWGSNPTGYFAILKRPIDFDMVESSFELPDGMLLNRHFGEIDYGYGTVVIRSE
jgi:hypothetical protein